MATWEFWLLYGTVTVLLVLILVEIKNGVFGIKLLQLEQEKQLERQLEKIASLQFKSNFLAEETQKNVREVVSSTDRVNETGGRVLNQLSFVLDRLPHRF